MTTFRQCWDWIKSHPQRLLGFTQVTLSQVALWDFIPPKMAAAFIGIAGLFQVWTAFLNKPEPKP